MQIIKGKHAILAAIQNSRRKIEEIYIKKSHEEFFTSQTTNLCYRIGAETVAIVNTLWIPSSLEQCMKYKRILLLDNIEDPQNLGSIIRTAAIMNFAIILRRGCSINTTVLKCASGGVEHIPICVVKSISRTLHLLRSNNFWIYALAENGENRVSYPEENICFIIGSEGKGVTRLLLKESDQICTLETYNNKFTTFNASVAAAMIMVYSTLK